MDIHVDLVYGHTGYDNDITSYFRSAFIEVRSLHVLRCALIHRKLARETSESWRGASHIGPCLPVLRLCWKWLWDERRTLSLTNKTVFAARRSGNF